MKKPTPPKKENGWLVMFLIFFTLAVFLFVILQSIPSVSKKTRSLVVQPTTPLTLMNKYLLFEGKQVEKPQLFLFIQVWLGRYFESVSKDLGAGKKLGELTVEEVSVPQKTLLIYDAKLQPQKKGFLVKIVIDPPPMVISWKDHNEYTRFYPLLNPYIHVMELEYIWVWTGKPEFNLTLSKLDFQMVDWKDNSYHKNYKDTKNSPLYRLPLPEPKNWNKEELLVFLTTMGLFNNITVVQKDLEISEIQGSPVEKTTA